MMLSIDTETKGAAIELEMLGMKNAKQGSEVYVKALPQKNSVSWCL